MNKTVEDSQVKVKLPIVDLEGFGTLCGGQILGCSVLVDPVLV